MINPNTPPPEGINTPQMEWIIENILLIKRKLASISGGGSSGVYSIVATGLSPMLIDQGNGTSAITITNSSCTTSSKILVVGKDNGQGEFAEWGELSVVPDNGSFVIMASATIQAISDARQIYWVLINTN